MLRDVEEPAERTPDNVPPGRLAHADQLQAEQAEYGPVVDEIFDALREAQKTSQPPPSPPSSGTPERSGM